LFINYNNKIKKDVLKLQFVIIIRILVVQILVNIIIVLNFLEVFCKDVFLVFINYIDFRSIRKAFIVQIAIIRFFVI
jgi:hypothetical protein